MEQLTLDITARMWKSFEHDPAALRMSDSAELVSDPMPGTSAQPASNPSTATRSASIQLALNGM